MADNTQNKNVNPSQAYSGLNKDSLPEQIRPGQLSDAWNAVVETFSGDMVSYSNEPANSYSFDLPSGYVEINSTYVPQLGRTFYFLVNPTTGYSQIGYAIDGANTYTPLIDDRTTGSGLVSDRLGFSIDRPIHNIEVKQTNCSTQIYWSDYKMRYIDLDDLPWKEVPNPSNDYISTKVIGVLDANKLNVMPNVRVPTVRVVGASEGGILKTGTYQFAVAYANSLGERYSQVYSVTNPAPIGTDLNTPDFNTATLRSLDIEITNIDTTGLYDYINIYVVKTINDISTAYLATTYPIAKDTLYYTYAGSDTEPDVAINEIFEKFVYYETAKSVTSAGDEVIWSDLTADTVINYQPIWAKTKLYWQTHQLPYSKEEGYANPANVANYKSFMRDEVYPIHGFFYTKSGRQTECFPLVSRAKTSVDDQNIGLDDKNAHYDTGTCDTPESIKKRWQVYNTASVLGYCEEYITYKKEKYGDSYTDHLEEFEPCYKGPYQYGEFAYWESTLKYNRNPYIYGNLVDQHVRHFKFPDNIIAPIHRATDNTPSAQHAVYPIGIMVDYTSLKQAIRESTLTAEQKENIVGFGIVRGDRTIHKSVVAKGIFSNVGSYTYKNENRYYANYPYNDVSPDPYFTASKLKPGYGYNPSRSLRGFTGEDQTRFFFHSPDTHFRQPSAITGGYVKVETIESGNSYGHFVPVKKNAEYKFLTPDTTIAAAGLAAAASIKVGTGTFGWPSVDLAAAIPTFTSSQEMFQKIIPYTNFGYMFSSTGFYNTHTPVTNSDQYKIRPISYSRYVTEGINHIEDGHELNHNGRESGIYLNTDGGLRFAHRYGDILPDNSRYTVSSYYNSTYSLDEFHAEFIATGSAIVLQPDIRTAINQYNQEVSDNYYIEVPLAILNQDFSPNLGDLYSTNTPMLVWEVTDVDFANRRILLKVVDSMPIPFLPLPSTLSFNRIFTSADEGGLTSFSGAVTEYNRQPQYVWPQVQAELQRIAGLQYSLEQIDAYLDFSAFSSLVYEAFYNAYYRERKARSVTGTLVPERMRESSIATYYGAIKRHLPAQWGEINSYQLLSTGMYYATDKPLYKDAATKVPYVFGGDTFITQFSLKTKVPLYVDTTFGNQNQADIQYDKLGQYGYPMFWLSTKPVDLAINIQNEINNIIRVVQNSPGVGGSGSVLSKIWTAFRGLMTGAVGNMIPAFKLLVKIANEMWTKIAIPNINLDVSHQDGIMEQGIHYLYSYGIPQFFVESTINTDLRQASDDTVGNYYPNVGGTPPDNWLQESVVPIINDNTYVYNSTYSKDNRENFFPTLRVDYDPNKICYTQFPNRAIYSDKSSLEENKNNWLFYRPLSYFDFPKSFGPLLSLDSLENSRILARFHSRSQLYNTLTTLNVSENVPVELGNPNVFATRPLDLSFDDLGSGGSQNRFLLNTPAGTIYTDTTRGTIYLLQGTKLTPLSSQNPDGTPSYMEKWFLDNLPFTISKYFPVDIDNNHKGIGIHGTFDTLNNRILITKLDYEPVSDCVTYEDGKFYCTTTTIEEFNIVHHICPEGFTYNQISDTCEKTFVPIPAEAPSEELVSVTNPNWGVFGMFLYEDDYTIIGEATLYNNSDNIFWKTRVNQLAKWSTNTGQPLNTWLGFSFCVDIEETKTYYVALSADNMFRLSIDGTDVLLIDNEMTAVSVYNSDIGTNVFLNRRQVLGHSSKHYDEPYDTGEIGALVNLVYNGLHVFPVTFSAGQHYIKMQGLNTDGPAFLACEIYDNTADEILAATSTDDLDIVFTMENQDQFNTGEFNCPTGYTLSEGTLCDLPQCVREPEYVEVLSTVLEPKKKTTVTKKEVTLDNTDYFCNRSWTLSYSFRSNSWVSLHSYTPLSYVAYPDYFTSNRNQEIWRHGFATNFNKFYDKIEPYILEYPLYYKGTDEILQYVQDYTTVRKYLSYKVHSVPDETIYFNKSIVRNDNQCSGILHLIPYQHNHPAQRFQYPKRLPTHTEILVTRSNNYYQYNQIVDIIKDPSKPVLKQSCSNIIQEPDPTNLSYGPLKTRRPPLQGKNLFIKHILDNTDQYQLISHFMVSPTTTSFK